MPITQLLEQLIKFPNAQVCKHYAALLVIQHLVEDPSRELVEAIFNADDETALKLLKEPLTFDPKQRENL